MKKVNIPVTVIMPDGCQSTEHPSITAAAHAIGISRSSVWMLAATGRSYSPHRKSHAHLEGLRVIPHEPISVGNSHHQPANAVIAYLPDGTVRHFPSRNHTAYAMGIGYNRLVELIDTGQPYTAGRAGRRSRCPEGTTFDLADPTP